MPSLRDYRDRIASVKSTRKITSAMKMVAASKLKKAQDKAETSQPYAKAMSDMMVRIAKELVIGSDGPALLVGTGKQDVHLLVVVSADRGLCGGFNANIIRRANAQIKELVDEGKEVKLLCVGRKAYDAFRRTHKDKILDYFTGLGGKQAVSFSEANEVTQTILDYFKGGEFDVCTVLYNEFQSVLTQRPMAQQLIPFSMTFDGDDAVNDNDGLDADLMSMPYEFEPSQDAIFEQLLPKNLGVQVFRALLDNAAGEQAARMTAMDNATRNAGDLIKDLTLRYNRARQAYITKELIEIISGAEAV
ncbi:MAG: F0F1 ATP synthase subunit gamma [Alphaproteobacteria bacterium]|nr:F0F1 ATP synthase subunit gamma [Alphaproteobacteria bacterium]MDP7222174.1 F0F1 ATP synthase subunit gamma [Alphaproteobacteria bacterium]